MRQLIAPSFMLGVLGIALSLSAMSCAFLEEDWPPPWPGYQPGVASAGTSAARGSRATLNDKSSAASTQPSWPLEATIEQAVLLAMENNRALRVERLNPPIQRTFEQQERALFEPVLSAEVSGGHERAESSTGSPTRDGAVGAGAAVSEQLPTGTTVDAGVTSERTWGTSSAERNATRAGLTVTQALLQGRGVAVNLADLRQARLDTRLSEYEFRGFAEALVAQVETTYWDYVLALRQVKIVEESLKLAERQSEETRHRIRVGGLAEMEIAAAEAEIALRREALINARSQVDTLRVQLLRLTCPKALPTRQRQITPQSKPTVPPTPLESVDDHVAVALRMRPDLNQAEILLLRDDLELVKTKNGLLPRMDLFISLGKSGYAESFGRSVGDIGGDNYDASIGLAIEYPVTNRDAKARHRRALLTRQQREESLWNLRDLVRQDVELAFIEVKRAREQVDATATTRKFQEEKLRAETAKFRVGNSTALLVAGTQRDLLASQVAEVEAVISYLKARTNLYLLEGSLLERRGLSAPGREPATQPREPARSQPAAHTRDAG